MPRLLGSAVGAFGLSWLFICVMPRVGFAWPLEWMEGAVLEHALRLLRGQPIYAAPSGEFIAFVYPPLSYVPIAISAALFGPELWAARVPSLLAVAVSLWFMARAATQLAGHWSAGALAAGLYAFGYGYTGGFLDLARVDATFMMLLVIGTERMAAGRPGAALAWFALASLAKQHGLLFMCAATPHALGESRVGLRRVLLVWGSLCAAVLALEWHSGGWFLTYTYAVPRKHGLAPVLLASFIAIDVCLYLPGLVGLTLGRLARQRDRMDSLLLAAVIAGALGRAHPGGDDNVRLPAYALLCLLGSVGYSTFASRGASLRRQVALSAVVLVQVAMLWQPPSLYRPSLQTERAFIAMHDSLTRCAGTGSSVALDHTRLTGVPFAHMLALSDLVRNGDLLGTQASNAVARALDAEDGPAAVEASGLTPPLRRAIDRHYELCATLPPLRLPSGFAPAAANIYRRVRGR